MPYHTTLPWLSHGKVLSLSKKETHTFTYKNRPPTVITKEYKQGYNQTIQKPSLSLCCHNKKIHDDCSIRLIRCEVASFKHYIQTLTESVLKQMKFLADAHLGIVNITLSMPHLKDKPFKTAEKARGL